MQNKARNQTIISVIVLVIVGAIYLWSHFGSSNNTSNSSSSTSTSSSQAPSGVTASSTKSAAAKPAGKTSTSAAASAKNAYTGANPSDLPTINESGLPAEGKTTLKLIRQGGPYPYDRDDINFGNYEGVLPKQSSGFYREYTVKTPGASTRGAKRIIAGKDGAKYYTSDHYATFKFIVEGK